MLKSILGVVVGYLVMMLVAFAAYTAAYLGLGADRAFEPDTYALSGIWIGLVIAITFVAGLIGGLTCAAISKSRTTGLVFAVIVFVLSLVFELPNIMKDHTPVARTGDVSNMEAMGKAQPPIWLCILNPFLGGAAVLMGTRMKKSPVV
jgi:membrane protease YdiL (CAAX protease family)